MAAIATAKRRGYLFNNDRVNAYRLFSVLVPYADLQIKCVHIYNSLHAYEWLRGGTATRVSVCLFL